MVRAIPRQFNYADNYSQYKKVAHYYTIIDSKVKERKFKYIYRGLHYH